MTDEVTIKLTDVKFKSIPTDEGNSKYVLQSIPFEVELINVEPNEEVQEELDKVHNNISYIRELEKTTFDIIHSLQNLRSQLQEESFELTMRLYE